MLSSQEEIIGTPNAQEFAKSSFISVLRHFQNEHGQIFVNRINVKRDSDIVQCNCAAMNRIGRLLSMSGASTAQLAKLSSVYSTSDQFMRTGVPALISFSSFRAAHLNSSSPQHRNEETSEHAVGEILTFCSEDELLEMRQRASMSAAHVCSSTSAILVGEALLRNRRVHCSA